VIAKITADAVTTRNVDPLAQLPEQQRKLIINVMGGRTPDQVIRVGDDEVAEVYGNAFCDTRPHPDLPF